MMALALLSCITVRGVTWAAALAACVEFWRVVLGFV